MLYHVVAVSKNGVIGKDGKLPWHFSSDLKFFKNLTTGYTVIMGRKTYDSIGKPLPNRENIVISRSAHPNAPGLTFVKSVDEAIKRAGDKNPVFIIGGASIFEETMDRISGIHLNMIHLNYDGDTFYPGIPEGFKEISRSPLQDDPLIESIFFRRALHADKPPR